MNETSSDRRPHGTDASGRRPPKGLVHATEPIARALAGRRWMPIWAVIRHRGRKSGTAYRTPIAVVPTTDPALVMIGLPWGAHTNWARNVVAEGGASLRWKARDVDVVHPRIVDGAEAERLAKPAFRAVVRRFPAAIVLDRAAPPVE